MNEEEKRGVKYVWEVGRMISGGCIRGKILGEKMGSKMSGGVIGRIRWRLGKMYEEKRKEVKEDNERIEKGSKRERV